MNKIFSPSNIEILLWCHTRAVPHERAHAPAVKETIDEFLRMGVIKPRDETVYFGVFTTTPLGKAWVEALCNVPPPKMVFVDELGRILE